MAERSLLPASDGWVLVVENHADGYSALVFASLIIRNRGSFPIYYSSHQDAPELSHSTLGPGKSVGVITRHLMVRAEGGDTEFELELSGLTAISSN